MNYEIESKLNTKVDKWELNALQQELRNLKSETQQLKENIRNCDSKLQSCYSAIESLQRILLDNEQFAENEDLHSLMRYL